MRGLSSSSPVALLLFISVCASQTAQHTPIGASAPATQSHAAPMTNADIMSLTAAGIEADIIISKIRSAPSTAFDTSVDALKVLKAAGVANDVIVNMVTGGTVPETKTADAGSTASSTSDFKEPVLKEGIWEERTTTTMRPGEPAEEETRSVCHSHTHDHLDFQKLRNGGGSERSQGSTSRGAHTSGNQEPDIKCRLTRAAVEDGKQIVEQQCQGHGITMSTKMNWIMADVDHMRSEASATYSPPVAGMSNMTTVAEMTFKGPCPAGVQPGDTVDDPLPLYQKKSKKGH